MDVRISRLGGRLDRRLARLLAAGGLALALTALHAGPAAAEHQSGHPDGFHDRGQTCAGTIAKPGVLAGAYRHDVSVEGVCAVNAGHAVVHGTLTVRSGSLLLAAFGRNDKTGSGGSSLTVVGDLRVQDGGSMLLGCEPEHFTCLDDPNKEKPTLSSRDFVAGDLRAHEPLGVIVHNSVVVGDVSQYGGGGGETCAPSGVFAEFPHPSPVYSDYEDNVVFGDLSVVGLKSCWLGLARDSVGGSMRVIGNKLADPDAIEIIANEIEQNLVCRANSMVWDSFEEAEATFPRVPAPNTVLGTRFGQCELASPTKEGGPLGPGPF